MIGNFNINKKKHETWKSISFTSNSCDAFNSYIKYNGSFIEVKYIENTKYYHTFEKIYKTDLETESPIYNQIINQEQIELYKLSKLVESHGGIVLDYNTDAINCIFENNEFPFELVDDIQLNGYYWDSKNEIPKYKIECDKERLKTSRMGQSLRTAVYKGIKGYKWNITTDETSRPEPNRQMNSSQVNTFYKFNINEKYVKYKMKCQELQQTLNKEVVIEPKLKYFNGLIRREYQIEKQDINCNKLNEDYNRHKLLNYYHEYLLGPPQSKFDFKNLNNEDKLKIQYYYYEYLNKFNELSDKIIKSNQSYFITGPGGTGKTYLVKSIQQYLKDNNIEYVSLAPTNIAALLINGQTLHKFVSKMKKKSCIKSMKIKYIFVDEFSMVHEFFYQYLLTVKKIRPDIKFVISADFNQLAPVNDRISPLTDYQNSPAFFELCDSNMLKLTKCRRSDQKLFDLIQFENIPNVKKTDFNTTNNFDNDIHICFTNNMRKHINHIKMKQLATKTKKCLRLSAQKHCEKSQDVFLNVSTPIISKINNESMNIYNNQRFIITKINKEKELITLKYKDNNDTFDIEFNKFQKFFLPAYSITTHCSQGMSIGEKYTIHEFYRMDQKLRYVALSRSRKHKYIHIMT